MAANTVNRWALRHYRALTVSTVIAVFDEIERSVAGGQSGRVIKSLDEAYALASRFKNVLYRYPFFKKKHLRILRAIIDRCGEADYKGDPSLLYISKDTIEEWCISFYILPEKIAWYLEPLVKLHILERSDRPKYEYKISDRFFHLIGRVARYLVEPVDTRRFASMMAVASGLSSIYVVRTAIRVRLGPGGVKPLIPWFLKLPMIYTLAGLKPGSNEIDHIMRLTRVNLVDYYFTHERERPAPIELWRSIRAEAFEFMADNQIIEAAVPEGYRLCRPWIKVHEEGVRRYVRRLREKYQRRYR